MASALRSKLNGNRRTAQREAGQDAVNFVERREHNLQRRKADGDSGTGIDFVQAGEDQFDVRAANRETAGRVNFIEGGEHHVNQWSADDQSGSGIHFIQVGVRFK